MDKRNFLAQRQLATLIQDPESKTLTLYHQNKSSYLLSGPESGAEFDMADSSSHTKYIISFFFRNVFFKGVESQNSYPYFFLLKPKKNTCVVRK